MASIFTKIINGEIPSQAVYEDDKVSESRIVKPRPTRTTRWQLYQ